MSGMGKGALRIAIEDFFETTKVGKWLAGYWDDFAEGVEQGILGEYSVVLDELDKIPELKKYLDLKGMLRKGEGHQGGEVPPFKEGVLGTHHHHLPRV